MFTHRGFARLDARSAARRGVACIVVSILAACASQVADHRSPGAPEASDVVPMAPALAHDGPLPIAASVETEPERPLQAMVVVTAPEPVTAMARVTGPGVAGRLVASEDAGTEVHVPLVALRESSLYDVEVEATARDGRTATTRVQVRTGVIPPGLVPPARIHADEGRRRPGLLVTAAPRWRFGGWQVVWWAVDRDGAPVWYYTDPAVRGRATPLVEPLPDGALLLMMADRIRAIDAFGRTLWEIEHDASFGGAFHHDVQVLPDGHVLVLGSELRPLPVPPLGGEMSVLGDVILELDPDGREVRRTALLDVLDPLRYPGELASRRLFGGGVDWSHSNAIVYDQADDSYLVSVRNQHWIVNLDRTTGDLLWSLGAEGDFDLVGDGVWFSAQHTPLWADGMLLMYDNGNERDPSMPPYSRLVGYSLDEETWTARQETEWIVPFYTPATGDVDDLGDAWLVTAGSPPTGDFAYVYEVPKAGDTPRWSVSFPTFLYRAEWLERLEVPPAPPIR